MKFGWYFLVVVFLLLMSLFVYWVGAASVSSVIVNSSSAGGLTTENVSCYYSGASGENLSFGVTLYKNTVLNMTSNPFVIRSGNLVAYYPFKDDVRDYAASYDGWSNLSNCAGKIGAAKCSNGVKQFMNTTGAFRNLTLHTICVGFYRNKDSGGFERIVSQNNDYADYSLSIQIDNGDNFGYTINNATSTTAIGTNIVTDPEDLVLRKWYFGCATYNGTHLQLYKNGVSVGTDTMPIQSFRTGSTKQALQVGRLKSNGAYQYGFNGTVERMSVWNVSLTQTEVLQQYYIWRDGGNKFLSNYTVSGDTFLCSIQPFNSSSIGVTVNSSLFYVSSCDTDSSHTVVGRNQLCGNLNIRAGKTLVLVNSTVVSNKVVRNNASKIVLLNSRLVA